MDDAVTALRRNGCVFLPTTTPEVIESFFVTVYGTPDLQPVTLMTNGHPDPIIYALGNPLEAVVLYNWTGLSPPPLYFRRIWSTPLTRGSTIHWVVDSYRPVSLVNALTARGHGRRSVLPLRWTSRPHIAAPLHLSPRADRTAHLVADSDGVFVCVDGLLLRTHTPQCWTGWHPTRTGFIPFKKKPVGTQNVGQPTRHPTPNIPLPNTNTEGGLVDRPASPRLGGCFDPSGRRGTSDADRPLSLDCDPGWSHSTKRVRCHRTRSRRH